MIMQAEASRISGEQARSGSNDEATGGYVRATRATVVLVVLLLAGACGSAAEQVIENAIENDLGEDVELDIDAGDGQINIETDEGSASFGGGEVPGALSDVVPSGGDVINAFEGSDGSNAMASVALTYPIERYDELVAFYTEFTAGLDATFQEGPDVDQRASYWTIQDHPELGEMVISVIEIEDFGASVTVAAQRDS